MPDAPTNEQACAHLRATVKDADPRKVGRAFSGGVMEIALAGFAGFTPPRHHPRRLPSASTGRPMRRARPSRTCSSTPTARGTRLPTGAVPPAGIAPPAELTAPSGPTRRAPLGRVLGARSGDKGGNANLGLWARDDPGYAGHASISASSGCARCSGRRRRYLRIERFELPNLRARNVVVHGLLGHGVASSTRPDAQAKASGSTCDPEWWTFPNRCSIHAEQSGAAPAPSTCCVSPSPTTSADRS
ncbi:hypothetical protein MGALJ_13680 [Mycobacterium gallinarum]|uniref:AtuA-like ferredoxin-fold domain-containing protein n=3 Tax=Mycobacteriaceae TaxID=1762 RepID=G8RXN4_MYCRN|nr:hypothetical protein MycrhN_5172 [Mycolicibacterium rhodesiae NBB3]BBY91699.1 hypothetical protein MGALJ_13680 [Mycobacterium gallinarum]